MIDGVFINIPIIPEFVRLAMHNAIHKLNFKNGQNFIPRFRSMATAVSIQSAFEYVQKISREDELFFLMNSEMVEVNELKMRLRLVTERCPMYR
jgi:hypothetical protein